MHRLLDTLGVLLPRRRRRCWRYVSGRRRRVALAAFAAVILGVAGWWHLTNDRRVRTTAEIYLRRLTGAGVRIRAARFGLLDGIRLQGVRLTVRQDGREQDLLEAREVLLRHRAMSLLRTGSLEVTEIICIAPVLTVTQDDQGRGWRLPALWGLTSARPIRMARRPVVRLRDGQVVFCERVQGSLLEVGRLSLNVSAFPRAGSAVYGVDIEGPDGRGQGTINLDTGQTRWTGDAPWPSVSRALPRRYRQLAARYALKGNVRFAADYDPDDGPDRLSVTLSDVSLALPAEEGGLGLHRVAGTIVIDEREIRLEDLTGQVGLWGDAPVRVSGRLGGLDASSDLELTVSADLALPLPATGQPTLDRIVGRVQRQIRPEGPATATVRLLRRGGGALRVAGGLEPRGLAACPRAFAYPLRNIEGQVDFDDAVVHVRQLTARRGDTTVTMTGRVESVLRDARYDLSIVARDLPLDDTLRQALWESVRPMYDTFGPRGRCDLRARVHGPDESVRADVDIDLARKARVTIRPSALGVAPSGADQDEPVEYVVEEMSGHLRVVGPVLTMDALGGRCGPTTLRLDGSVRGFRAGRPDVELALRIENLELDDRLARSLGAGARAVYDSFHPAGRADLAGTVAHRGGRLEDFDLMASLKGVDLTYDGFAYPLTRAVGVLRLRPDRVTVDRVAGRAGPGRLRAQGQVRPGRPVGIDLRFDAQDVALDDALRRALPSEATEVWDSFSPHGQADATVELHLGPADPADRGPRPAYRIRIDSRDPDGPGIGIRYAALAYPLEHIRGLVEIEPDSAVASDLTAGADESPIVLAGKLVAAEGRVSLLSADGTSPGPDATTQPLLSARNLPVDEALLRALPGQAGGWHALLTPGGSLDLSIRELALNLPTVRAAGTASAPAGLPDRRPLRVQGQLGLHGVSLGGPRGAELTGKADIRLSDQPDHPVLEADLDLTELALDGRAIQQVRGRLVKPTAEPTVHLLDLAGATCGGRLAGAGELTFGPGVDYRLTVNVERIDLERLLPGEGLGSDAPTAMTGRLAGRLAIRGVAGQVRNREAVGQLVITEGRLVRVPIVLGLVNTIFLQLPTSDAFSEGQLEYRLRGNDLFLANIHLSGANASILGSGRVNLADEQVSVVFVSGAPRLVPSVFAELWHFTAEGLLPTVVTGSWRAPRTQTVPLSELQKLLQEMRPH